MRGNGSSQFWNTVCRWVLIATPLLNGLCSNILQQLGTVSVGESLSKIDGTCRDREGGHLSENRRAVLSHAVHHGALHTPTVSIAWWRAIPDA